jgi:hypothetical protein
MNKKNEVGQQRRESPKINSKNFGPLLYFEGPTVNGEHFLALTESNAFHCNTLLQEQFHCWVVHHLTSLVMFVPFRTMSSLSTEQDEGTQFPGPLVVQMSLLQSLHFVGRGL